MRAVIPGLTVIEGVTAPASRVRVLAVMVGVPSSKVRLWAETPPLMVTVKVPVPSVPAEKMASSPLTHLPVVMLPAELLLQLESERLVLQMPEGVVPAPVVAPLVSQ